MNISEAGLDFIKANEGFSARPYWDVNGYSMGYGHHFQENQYVPPQVTEEAATAWLMLDLKPVIASLNSQIPEDCTQCQFDALCDFGYNLGVGALDMMLSHGWHDLPNQMPKWVYAGGKVNQGLVERRKKEVALFTSS